MVVEAVLLDVGGTLWPDQWTRATRDRADKVARLRSLDPGLDKKRAGDLADALEAMREPGIGGAAQATNESIAAVLADLDIGADRLDPVVVRRAISLPFDGRHQLLPGAGAMMRALKADGLILTVISNTIFRDAECYRQDFAAAGLDRCLSGIITSVDVGWRKPDPAIFAAALAVTGVAASRSAMVGNSETSDIAPALELGMVAILVAIEQPPPTFSAADAVVTSLEDVPAVIKVS